MPLPYDLLESLAKQDSWVPLGAADEGKPAADGTVEAWGRSADHPVGGWYGLRKGYRAGSACTSRRCWRPWAWPSSPTTPVTTRCGRYSHGPFGRKSHMT